MLQSLKDEPPKNIAKAVPVPDTFHDPTDTAQDLPNWAAALQKRVLVQPSSAAAESVFFPCHIEATMRLRVNNLQRQMRNMTIVHSFVVIYFGDCILSHFFLPIPYILFFC